MWSNGDGLQGSALNSKWRALTARCQNMGTGGAGVFLLCLPWLALLVWLASVSWFLTDDAFISFRYVRNLLEGHGLVFNPGERVEGYSNFLWVLELAAVWRALGVAPEDAAPWLSVVFTAGTVGALAWWIARQPSLRNRGLVGWMALGLVCSSATFAVWTSGGGLETRQFTFLIVLAVVCLSLYRGRRAGLLAASLSLAGAALTRPEGPLIAVCCFGWFAVQRMADAKRMRVDWRELAYLAAPFAILVAAHFLFRYAYYGEWLPNTYYAKHVRPWYESGFRYLWAAALDTGLYLLIPLAWVALRHRWRETRDGIYALVLLLIAVHAAYVMRIGGDHFEYRPLDFYWPLLALPAAEGIACVGSRIAAFDWRRIPRPTTLNSYRLRRPGVRTCALILFVPVIFYCGAIQGALLFEGAKIDERIKYLHIELDGGNAGWLLAAPGMPVLVAVSNELRRQSAARSVALPFAEHREFANRRLRGWQPYEDMERGVIPDDALMAGGTLGIRFYYLPDLKVIDRLGLADATVARNPVATPNHQRFMAHDRSPPPGYLEQRGVNFTAYPAAFSEVEALERARYAVKVGPGLWLPFDSDDHKWVAASFAGQDLRAPIEIIPEGDYIARLVGDREPSIRSDWDVYFSEDTLTYVKEPCAPADTEAWFFLALYPVDVNDLPDDSKQYGFDNLDFRFDRRGVILDGRCTATVALPEYDIASIGTGQYVPVEGGYNHLWEGEFRLGE